MEEEQPQQQEKKGKGKATGKRFEVKKWNAVAMWSWAICTDTCAICRNNLYEPSIEYQANPTGKKLTNCLNDDVLAALLHQHCPAEHIP